MSSVVSRALFEVPLDLDPPVRAPHQVGLAGVASHAPAVDAARSGALAPVVSLLFSTRNRAEPLKDCLDHIARLQASCPWELVVVDNGSTDHTGQVLADYAARMPFPVHVLQEDRPGKSHGLNQGLRVARGEFIALIDDDCYVPPDYIDRVRESFDDPRIGFAGGRVELFDPTDAPMTIKTATEPELLPPHSYVQPGWILGANMMFRRAVLEAIGGFDPELGPGRPFYGEDPDIQARASFAGWWGYYNPAVEVAHHHRRKAPDAAVLRRIYSKGTGSYSAKFLLRTETRAIYLRSWYWTIRRMLRGGYAPRDLLWEVQGATAYLAYRLRRRVAGPS